MTSKEKGEKMTSKERSGTKLLLFLDDWFLESKIDIVRRFAEATPVPLSNGPEMSRFSIIYDQQKECFRAWGKVIQGSDKACLYESGDGVSWEKTPHAMKVYKKQIFDKVHCQPLPIDSLNIFVVVTVISLSGNLV